ncbi:MAG TPA: zinc-ribbon domain-containing protein [Myxococcales bacterium]
MLIECSRCHAVFSLQDGIAAAGARFKVQCGRCQEVFETVAAPRTHPPPPPDATPAEPALAATAPSEPAPPLVEVASATPELVPAAGRPSTPRFERRRGPLMQLRVLLAVIALAIAAGVVLYRRGLPRAVEENLRQGREKLLLDDEKSLQEATKLFTEAVRVAPGNAVAEAERAFALLLQASAHKDLAMRVPQRDEENRAAARLLQQGAAAARQAIEDDQNAPAALRAIALAEALSAAPEPAAAHAEQAERAAPGDPWVLYAKAAAAAAGRARDRAIQALSAARQAEPRLLRADVDLAGFAIDGGDPAGARELLQRVLRNNPQHERARRMLSLLPP